MLIIGSGAATHNLWAFGDRYDAPPPAWAVAFDQWLGEAIAQNDVQSLLNYRQLAPYAAQNHPTEEHLLPLLVALGTGGAGRQIHQGFTYGAFSMAAYAFD
ncbi:MAG: DODA-type extradiol aromatic ring-opening family dioxygenase [Nodosilinea sp.]